MKWTVTWVPPAETQLAALWLDGNIRGAVTEAARRIERALDSVSRAFSVVSINHVTG